MTSLSTCFRVTVRCVNHGKRLHWKLEIGCAGGRAREWGRRGARRVRGRDGLGEGTRPGSRGGPFPGLGPSGGAAAGRRRASGWASPVHFLARGARVRPGGRTCSSRLRQRRRRGCGRVGASGAGGGATGPGRIGATTRRTRASGRSSASGYSIPPEGPTRASRGPAVAEDGEATGGPRPAEALRVPLSLGRPSVPADVSYSREPPVALILGETKARKSQGTSNPTSRPSAWRSISRRACNISSLGCSEGERPRLVPSHDPEV